jgi:sarcosine oxidase
MLRVRIGVVGAGIVGLATAYELSRHPDGRADVTVRCYDAGEPMAARSVGDTRIFRTGHADPLLVALALRAHGAWRRWEDEFQAPLLGSEGVVVSGPSAATWAVAMEAAGSAAGWLESAGPPRIPAAHPPRSVLVDPLGGVIAAGAAGRCLAAATARVLRRGEPVVGVETSGGNRALIRTPGEVWECDRVLLLAGAGTPALAAPLGIAGVPTMLHHHHRFTFRLDPSATPPADGRPSCWLDQSGDWRPGFTTYQHLAGPGLWAIGGSLGDEDTAWELGVGQTRERAREVVTRYVRERLSGVATQIVDSVHCDSLGAADGINVRTAGPVIALWGDNLFKFAPVLGSLLAASALATDLVSDLRRLC